MADYIKAIKEAIVDKNLHLHDGKILEYIDNLGKIAIDLSDYKSEVYESINKIITKRITDIDDILTFTEDNEDVTMTSLVKNTEDLLDVISKYREDFYKNKHELRKIYNIYATYDDIDTLVRDNLYDTLDELKKPLISSLEQLGEISFKLGVDVLSSIAANVEMIVDEDNYLEPETYEETYDLEHFRCIVNFYYRLFQAFPNKG